MIKKVVSTAVCNVGDIVAEDILTISGVKLIGENTLITSYIKNRLLEMNIPYIKVHVLDQELNLDLHNSDFIFRKEYLENVAIGKIVYIPPHDIANPVIYVNNEYIDLADKASPRIAALI